MTSIFELPYKFSLQDSTVQYLAKIHSYVNNRLKFFILNCKKWCKCKIQMIVLAAFRNLSQVLVRDVDLNVRISYVFNATTQNKAAILCLFPRWKNTNLIYSSTFNEVGVDRFLNQWWRRLAHQTFKRIIWCTVFAGFYLFGDFLNYTQDFCVVNRTDLLAKTPPLTSLDLYQKYF